MLKLSIRKPVLILDSGAFSVWTKGKALSIDEYADYILNNLSLFDYFVNLDVIPGKPNQKLNADDVDGAARQSLKNANYLLKKGVPIEKLIPVFHQGEDIKWLKKMLIKYPYIGISPANDKTILQRILWIDSIADILFNKDGSPKAKYHGFGVTSIQIMERYPWESVDSRRWLNGAINGYIYIPTKKKNEFDFVNSFECTFSKKNIRGRFANYNICTPLKKKMIHEWCNCINQNIDEVYDSYKKRNVCNFLYFLYLQEQLSLKRKINIVFAGGETVARTHLLKDDKKELLQYGPSFLLSYAQIKNLKAIELVKELKL